ncbi:MAG: hypothetical protein D3908_04325 [Candidatus Electrothrix sp. AUS4]|nr:hypothetical protein [Candidatus Electrothrix sp. AUS4]
MSIKRNQPFSDCLQEEESLSLMQRITVTGVLIADQWEPDGRIAGLALLTDDESKYLINPEEFGEDFNAVLRKKVEIRGVLTGTIQERRIHIFDYRLAVPIRSWS